MAQSHIHLRFAWQAWHSWHWVAFAWQAWHLVTSTFVLRGRRGTWWHPRSFCVADVALMALGWLWWRAWTGLVAGDAAALCVAGVALRMTRTWLKAWHGWRLRYLMFWLKAQEKAAAVFRVLQWVATHNPKYIMVSKTFKSIMMHIRHWTSQAQGICGLLQILLRLHGVLSIFLQQGAWLMSDQWNDLSNYHCNITWFNVIIQFMIQYIIQYHDPIIVLIRYNIIQVPILWNFLRARYWKMQKNEILILSSSWNLIKFASDFALDFYPHFILILKPH